MGKYTYQAYETKFGQYPMDIIARDPLKSKKEIKKLFKKITDFTPEEALKIAEEAGCREEVKGQLKEIIKDEQKNIK